MAYYGLDRLCLDQLRRIFKEGRAEDGSYPMSEYFQALIQDSIYKTIEKAQRELSKYREGMEKNSANITEVADRLTQLEYDPDSPMHPTYVQMYPSVVGEMSVRDQETYLRYHFFDELGETLSEHTGKGLSSMARKWIISASNACECAYMYEKKWVDLIETRHERAHLEAPIPSEEEWLRRELNRMQHSDMEYRQSIAAVSGQIKRLTALGEELSQYFSERLKDE